MEYSKLKSLLRRVIVVPMVIMAAFAGLLLWETFDLNKSLQWVDHTDQVLDQSGHLLKLLVDMESGTRGYIATGDESFLQPYLEGTKDIDPEYQALYGMVADNPPQQQRLKEIHAGYVEWDGYASGLSPFAAREKPIPLSMRTSRENAEWMPFESRSRSFKMWKLDCVSSAFKPRTCDGP
jgi:hypothetical protein